ncbi:dynamin family protein [Neobacillus sp. Marseille-QA0830]
MQTQISKLSIKNPKIRNLMKPLEEEELLVEVEVKITGPSIWPDEEEFNGTFILTDKRIGFFDQEVEGYFYNSILYVKQCFLYYEQNQLYFSFNDFEKREEDKFWIQLHDQDTLDDVYDYIHGIRYEHPIPVLVEELQEAYSLISKNSLDEALRLLYGWKEVDPMNGIIDLMITRTLNLLGKSSQAVVHVARRISYLLYFDPESILFEHIWYNWHEGALRYLPEWNGGTGDPNSVRNLLLRAIYAKARQDYGEMVEALCMAFRKLAEQDETIYIRGVKVLGNLIEISEPYNAPSLSKLVDSVLAYVGELEMEEEEIRPFINVITNLASSITEPENYNYLSTFELVLQIAGDAPEFKSDYLAYTEAFQELSELEYLPNVQADEVEDWTTSGILGADELWGDLDPGKDAEINIRILFAKLRTDRQSPALILQKVNRLATSLAIGRLREKDPAPSSANLYYYAMQLECLIKLNRIPEALHLLMEWRKDLIFRIGHTDPFVRHIDDMLLFWEGAALSSKSAILESLSRIPKDHPFMWLHELGEQFLKNDLEKVEIDGPEAVMGRLQEIVLRMEKMIEGKQKRAEVSGELNRYKEYLQKELRTLVDIKREEKDLQMFRRGQMPTTPSLKIALVGETSAGKTTLMNSLFSTNIFFATQEEATGVPTEISRGEELRMEVWDQSGHMREQLVVDPAWLAPGTCAILKEHLPEVQSFMFAHTQVGSPMLQWVDKVKVYFPLASLPEQITLIDSPGFNGNEARSAVANRVVENSHISLFIMDARNALKGKEIGILEMVREEAGKIFVILNKMDLVFGDDDLDCDGEGAAEETIERVRRDLANHLDVEQVILYPVCSLPKSEVSQEAWRYIDNLHSLIQKVFEEAEAQQLDLLVDKLAKESILLSNKVTAQIEQEIVQFEDQLTKVQQVAPVSYELFEEEIRDTLNDSFYSHRDVYIERLSDSINGNLLSSVDGFENWLLTVSSNSVLKNNAKSKAESLSQSAVTQIEKVRSQELSRMVQRLQEDIIRVFEELYANLPFKSMANPRQLLNSLPSLQLAMKSNLGDGFNSINYGGGLNGGSAIGAVIGAAFLGPLGAVLGGFLGNLLGGKSLGQVKQELYEAYINAVEELRTNIIDLCDKDLNMQNMTSFVNSLNQIIEGQLQTYQKTIEAEIQHNKHNIVAVENEIVEMKLFTAEINITMEQFKEWRYQRRKYII